MKLILTRHSTTEWNLLGRWQGHTDIGLNPQGRAEAEELAKALFSLDIDLIVSSDLQRASETARIINEILNLPLKLESALRECAFGKLEGLTKQQIIEQHGSGVLPSDEEQYHNYDFRAFGGEHRDAVWARHLQILESLVSAADGKTALLVGHGRGLNTLLSGLGHKPDLKRGEIRIVEYRPR